MTEKMRAFYVEADWEPREGVSLPPRERSSKVVSRGGSVWRNMRGSVVDRPKPGFGPDEVLIRVGAAGVCGTDVHLLQTDEDGYTKFDGHTHYPIVTGHEFSGTVIDVGWEVTHLSPGDMVAVESMNWCGHCAACRRGFYNQCREVAEPGLTFDGGLAEFVTVPGKHCFSLGDVAHRYAERQTVLEIGALVEPTSVAYNALFVLGEGFRPGGHAVVFGAGPVGLVTIALLKATGAGRIIVAEMSPERRQLALDAGADEVLDPREETDIVARIMSLTGGAGASIIAECSGATRAVYPTIQQICAPGALVAQIGIGLGDTPIDTFAFQKNAVRLISAIGQSGSGIYEDVISLIANGRLNLEPVITHRVGLEDAPNAFALCANGKTGKVLISTQYE